jgi:hypothetical protein
MQKSKPGTILLGGFFFEISQLGHGVMQRRLIRFVVAEDVEDAGAAVRVEEVAEEGE